MIRVWAIILKINKKKFSKVGDQKFTMKLANEQQRENIFHIRYHISNKICSMIIDSENWANISSIILVKKLNLNTVKHDRPYKFRWLNECVEVMMTK